jgi:RND family efflux transporter MFP subunit
MRKFVAIGVVAVLVAGAAVYFGFLRREEPAAAAGTQADGGQREGQGGRGRGGRGGAQGQGGSPGGGFGSGMGGPGGGFRPPMTVEVTKVSRGNVSALLTVVGNLIGEQTVDVVPRAAGRITSISVRLGDRIRRGQLLAKIEDREIVEQVRQAEASHQVAEATIRQREADLNLAQTNVERSRNLFARQLLPKQTLDDAEARYTSAVAALDLARAQLAQSQARMQELKINLANTNVISPVDGFVSKRNLDVGAMASQNQPVASVVDISSLRLVTNVVEKDLKAVNVGDRAQVEVDAFPGEKFSGRIARLSPVLDPSTRTAQMEIEILNPQFRLKPGMYARVDLTVEDKQNVLVVPKIALVDSQGERGVYQPSEDGRAKFKAVKVGIENNDQAEILEGLTDGEVIVSTGAGALRRDDQLVVAGAAPGGRGGRGNRGEGSGAPGGPGTPSGPGAGGPGAFGQRQPGQGGTRPEGQPGEGLQRGDGQRGGRGRGQRPDGSGQRPDGSGQQDGENPAGRRPRQNQSVEQQRPIA